MTPDTIVHLVRHGEVHNPQGVLYGRRDGFHLSDRGRAMADRVGEHLGGNDITVLRSSPLERARETAAPLAERLGLEIGVEPRVLESTNRFEGLTFGKGNNALRNPLLWRHLYNPFKPSWGEPYRAIVTRMMAAVHDARRDAEGHEAVLVSHQLPIWTTRLAAEKRSFLHDPRKRQCTLCSITSFGFAGEELVAISYAEPAIDLIPTGDIAAPFSAGDAPEENKPEGTPQ
ncbi:histidine phosphatase family protein [Nocardioides caeni]|uniref:Histidine phosphatase family protein n=1 Tax=Nocardioides caeni TaxID=574700 RepID=A0A4S8NDH8_9ACTN|nr:histidine phosphatase family protein [Nocardioides caeni]THV12974.1 histidine phosphatase family protein [Nocardioides caeni]